MIAEKQSLRAALAAAICAFGVSFGAVFCPVSAFGLPVDNWALLLVCLAASIVFSVIFAVFRPVYGFGAAAVAAGAFAWFFHGEALQSAMGLLGGILEEYVQAFHFSMPQALADAAESGADATMALGILAALLALCTVWTVLSRGSLLGVFLASLPFLVVCLVILQTEPATLPMLTLTGSLTLLVLTQKLRFDTTQSGHRLTLHLMVPVAILMAALALIFPRYGYERSAWSKSLSPIVSRTAEKFTVFRRNAATGQVEFVSPFTPSTLGRWVWDSNVSSVNLKRVGPQRKTGRRVMQVYSDVLYSNCLRADSLAVYENSSWRALTDEDYADSSVSPGVLLAPDVQTLGYGTPVRITIRTDMKSSIFYVPYRPFAAPEDGEVVYDAYIKNPSQLTEYTIETAFVEETADRNAQYERFVHRTYTQLPDDIRPDLQAIVSGIDGADASDTKTAALAIAKYVSKSKTYSLDTPRAPEGEDFALWFLRESDTGYCVHFATATALLLRAANIPSRYVTGYQLKVDAGQWTDVSEDDAHAWVEYYIDGMGWQIMDATPAEVLNTQTQDQPQQEQPQSPSTGEEKTNTQDINQPETAAPEPSQSDLEPQTEAPEKTTGAAALHVVWIVLFALLALCVWQLLLLSLRKAAMQTGSNNKRAVAYWRHIEFLCKLDKSEPPDELRNLALKARFSQHKLDGSELDLLRAFSAQKTQQLLADSDWLKRFWLRAGLALHPEIRR